MRAPEVDGVEVLHLEIVERGGVGVLVPWRGQILVGLELQLGVEGGLPIKVVADREDGVQEVTGWCVARWCLPLPRDMRDHEEGAGELVEDLQPIEVPDHGPCQVLPDSLDPRHRDPHDVAHLDPTELTDVVFPVGCGVVGAVLVLRVEPVQRVEPRPLVVGHDLERAVGPRRTPVQLCDLFVE